MPPDLSVVIPAYNEASRLPATLAGLRPFLEGLGREWELIVSNDGSQDATSEIAHAAAAEDGRIRALDNQPNRGKGPAVRAGVAASAGRLVLITDADLSTPLSEYAKLCAAVEQGADVAVASRAKKGAEVMVSQPFHRVLMGKSFNLLVQLVVLPGIWDTQCGFKLWRGDLARAVFQSMKLEGNVAFDVEVLYRARRRGARIAEVPVRWVDSVPSRILPLRHSREAFLDLFRIPFLK